MIDDRYGRWTMDNDNTFKHQKNVPILNYYQLFTNRHTTLGVGTVSYLKYYTHEES